MVKVVVDSSVLIEKMRMVKNCFYDKLVELQSNGKVDLLISVIVIAELWTGDSMNQKVKIESAETLIKHLRRIVVNEDISKLAGEIMRKHKIQGMDALIVASALESEAELATLNTKHFVNVKGLKLYHV